MDVVREAMRVIERRGFLRPEHQDDAAVDRPLPIGNDQSNSQPRTVSDMLVLLDVAAGMRVLDVGAGSGWTTALLAHLVGPGGHVVGVELDHQIASWGATNLARHAMGWARLEPARSGVLGWPDEAPYDRVLVSAQAQELPGELVDQLTVGGVMVVPVNGTMTRVQRFGPDDLHVTEHGAYRFVPLR